VKPSAHIIVGRPIKAIYIDWHLNWNTPQQSVLDAVNAGFNVIIISFYLSGGNAADMAQAWAALDNSVKQSTIQQAHAKGAVVTVSLGGSTDSPFSHEPYSLGQQVGKWALSQALDGVDFDVENLAQGFKGGSMSDTQTVDWMIKVTQGTYDTMGNGSVISHAPQAPYFGPVGNSQTWTGTTGGYTSVYLKVPNAITFFNVQFYNQGPSCYTDYNGLFVSSGASCPVFPYTAVMEIAKGGIPLSKIVVGKPVTSADASNGWVSGSTLHTFFQQAGSSLGWNAGVMGWVWNDAATLTNWIQSIYSGSTNGGVTDTSGPSATSTTSTTTTTTTTTGTTGGGDCSGKPDGMYCKDSTHFMWCPSAIVQQCAPGTTCQQNGASINCV